MSSFISGLMPARSYAFNSLRVAANRTADTPASLVYAVRWGGTYQDAQPPRPLEMPTTSRLRDLFASEVFLPDPAHVDQWL